MQDPAYTAISGVHRSLLRASALRGMKLHVAAVDGYALRWLISRFLPVEPRAFEPLTKANATKEARDGGQCRSLVRASARAALLHKATSSVRLVHLSLRFLPANRRKKEVDPTRLELVSSAIRGRHEGLQEFSGACKTPANEGILMMLHFSVLQDIHSGCCTVAAHSLRLNLGW
jgi:hypothetical protein